MKKVMLFVLVAGLLGGSLAFAQESFQDANAIPASDDPSFLITAPCSERFSELDEVAVAIVKNQTPWSNSNEAILDTMEDVTYDIIGYESFNVVDWDDYDLVIIASNQSTTFYTNLANEMDDLEAYVDGGGWLEFHGAHNAGANQWELWDGTTYITGNVPENVVVDEDHPITQGLDETLTGNSASHGKIVDEPDDCNVIIETSDGYPSLIEYTHGLGTVILSTMTMEWLWANQANYTGGPVLGNTLNYAVHHPTVGALEGTVTDSDEDPLENVEITVWTWGDDPEMVDQLYTDADGYYFFDNTIQEGAYALTAFLPTYVLAEEDSIYITCDDTLTVDFTLEDNEDTGTVSGYVYSAEEELAIEGIDVTIPVLDESVTTDEDGYFTFGAIPTGSYTIVVTDDPPGSEGHHTNTYPGIEVATVNEDLEFYIAVLLDVENFTISAGNGYAELAWDAPSNHEEDLMLVMEEIEDVEAEIAYVEARNVPEEMAKMPAAHQRLYQLRNMRDRMILAQENELDDLADFIGYAVLKDGEIIPDYRPTSTSVTISGLDNGHLYTFAVAADYGYGNEYLHWSDTLEVRPMPEPGYIITPMDYEWIEINPDEGGDGEVAHDNGDDANSGEVSIAPLSFSYYGNVFESFGACTNGWMSMSNFTSNTIGPSIPSTSDPNNTIVALNGDYHAGVSGDDCNIWYYVDEGNDRVIIQFCLRPYSGSHTDYRHNYQVVLDCATDYLHFNYNTSEDWMEYVRANGVIGVENGTGTTASTFNMSELEDETSYLIRYVADFGNIVGTVVDTSGNPVEGAFVYLMGDETMHGISDENGYYEILLADTTGQPYTVVCHADGYEHEQEESVSWEEGEFEITVDFEVTPISTRTAPYVSDWDGDYDDGISIALGQPGSYEHNMMLQLDDGIAANGYMIPEVGQNQMMAVPFITSQGGRLVQTEIQLANPDGIWGAWPDASAGNVIVRIHADNNGLPGDVLYTSSSLTPDLGAVLDNPRIEVGERFWVSFAATDNFEGILTDREADFGNRLLFTNNGQDWYPVESAGDPLVRVTLTDDSPIEAVDDYSNITVDWTQVNPEILRLPVSAAHQAPIYGRLSSYPVADRALQSGWSGANELDEFMGFNVYYSTDGEDFEQANDELIEDDVYFLQLDSDLEDQDIIIYLEAEVDSAGETIYSDPSEEVTCVFNMAPATPTSVQVVDIDEMTQTGTVTWNAVTTNADGSPCVDLEGYVLYRDGELLAELDPEVTEYDEAVIDPGFYNYAVIAYDEVPNVSGFGMSPETQIGNPPFYTGFEPEGEPDHPNPFVAEGDIWEWGEPTAGPGEAYAGDYVWATLLDGNYATQTSDRLVATQTWPVIGNLKVKYYHWYSFYSSYDGYNLKVSTNGGDSWTVVTPTSGYYTSSCYGLNNEPAFGYTNNSWQQVEFDLTAFNDADSITIAWDFGSYNYNTGMYYGVAIDELEIWGVPRAERGSLTGFVMDSDDVPMEGVHVFIRQYPNYDAYTDPAGNYFIFAAPAETLDVVAEYMYYWPSVASETVILDRDTITVDFTNGTGIPMVYPDGEPTTTSLEMLVDINATVGDTTGTVQLDIESVGTGVLGWDAYVQVLNDAPSFANIDNGNRETKAGPVTSENGRMMRKFSQSSLGSTITSPNAGRGPEIARGELDELWDMLYSFNPQMPTQNNGIVSAVIGVDGIYVGAIDNGDGGVNAIYKFSRTGVLQETYLMPAELHGFDDAGPLDLGYDPKSQEFYGGVADGHIYRFNAQMTDVEYITTVDFHPTGVTYDWDHHLLYLREWDTRFGVYDVDSDSYTDLYMDNTTGLSMGLAYMPADPDDYNIYILSQNEDGLGGYIYRYSPYENAYDLEPVELYAPVEGEAAGGIEIGRWYAEENDSWDIATVYQRSQDIVNIWEGYYAPPTWVSINPNEGLLEPSEIQELTINADFRGVEDFANVQVGEELQAEVVFRGPYWANPPVVDLIILFYDSAEELGEDAMPTTYALHQNYPNPFNPLTSIRFDLVNAQDVNLTVFNVMGQEVARLVEGRLEAGFHEVRFDAQNFASGVYFYRIEAGPFTDLKRMVLVK